MVFLGSADALVQADALSWREFETLVQTLFEAHGYACRHVGGKKDHGADVIATKDEQVLGIQVKHQAGGLKWTGERAVQAVVTSLPLYKCTGGVVVTNSTFAPGVRRVARAHGIVLRDRSWLAGELASFCVLCGVPVSARVRKWCLDRHDDYGGNTYCFDHQRGLEGLVRTA